MLLGLLKRILLDAVDGVELGKYDLYITPKLHAEILAKKAAVAERRAAFWKTLSRDEQKRRKKELKRRVRNNEPMLFAFVDDTEGEVVSFTLFIFHITLHDMFPAACAATLTEECLLAGLKCNAVSVGRFVRIADMEGFYEVQPRWIEGPGEPK